MIGGVSEVLTGVKGNNNFEFIELHNTGNSIIDLQGWSLWYQLTSDGGELPIFRWEAQFLIPPHGHFLLGRAGQDLGIVKDAEFEQGLITTKGGLELRRPDGDVADALGWGENIIFETTQATSLISTDHVKELVLKKRNKGENSR